MKNTHTKLLRLMLALFLLLSMALTAFAVDQTQDVQQDTTAPVILHQPIRYAKQGHPLVFQATVTDETAVASVELFCRGAEHLSWRRFLMNTAGNDIYTFVLDAAAMTVEKLEYYFQVSDGTNVAALESYTILLDKGITVHTLSADRVPVSEAANTPVTVIGEGFSQEMTVSVGGVDAAFTFISETEIQLTLPALGIGNADLVITNGESRCTRAEAITYEDPLASVKVTAPGKVYIGQKVGFPILLSASTQVTEASMQIQMDPTYFTDVQFVMENVSENITASFDISADGLVSVEVSGRDSIVSEGPIGYLTAQVSYVQEEIKPVISVEQASFHGVDVHGISCDVVISNAIDIRLLNVPEQLFVLEGDAPDFSAWELEIDYEGPTQRIPVTQDMISISQENPGEGKVTYFHKEAPFTFLVLNQENTALVIKTPASKTNYILGESLDLTGLTLELSHGDGQMVLPVEDYTVSGFDAAKSGKQTVTLTFRGFKTSMEVIVFQRGDINQDGKITLLDMVNVKSHVLGMTTLTDIEALAADYNGDGNISILDYIQIKAVILGISVEDGE